MADQNNKNPNQDPTAMNDKNRDATEKKGSEGVGQNRDIADIDIDKKAQNTKDDDELLKKDQGQTPGVQGGKDDRSSKVNEQNKKSA